MIEAQTAPERPRTLLAERPLTWVEVDVGALGANVQALRQLVGPRARLCAMVKGNAYGHGLRVAARAFSDAGADWFGVNDLAEAASLRADGHAAPIYSVGYLPPWQMAQAVALDVRFVCYDASVVEAASVAARSLGKRALVHLKVETGNNRQGLLLPDALALARRIAGDPHLALEGLSTHFADVEDTTDHVFAEQQLARFEEARRALAAQGTPAVLVHCANSAATILWPHTHDGLVRTGIAAYGLWPSRETFLSAKELGRDRVALRPALTWKTIVAQIRTAATGEFVGYGRTFRTTHPTRIGVLPVGYYDGYDRGLTNLAHVLVDGHRAPVRGRVAMNIVTVDLTDIPAARVGSEVVLLGAQGDERITAEQMGAWIGSINYEVTTRINDRLERVPVAP